MGLLDQAVDVPGIGRVPSYLRRSYRTDSP
jgi:hypothetical protein